MPVGLAVELESPAGGLLAVRVLDVDVFELGGEEGGRVASCLCVLTCMLYNCLDILKLALQVLFGISTG